MAVTIPRAALDLVSDQVNAMSADARAKVLRVLERISWTPENVSQCRELVVEALCDVLPTYTDAAAQASADLYDAVREASVGQRLGATAASGYDPAATDGAIRAFVQKVVDGREIEVFNRLVLSRVDYELRRAANYCVTENGARDPLRPRYARVPTGAETCDFCLMLASRGFVYHSASSAAVDHTHDNCVLPDTNLGAVGVRAGLRRKYEGVICHITTSGGRHLSVTPNHPILTVRGWVDAGHLKDGDALLCRSVTNRNDGSVPNVDKTPPSAYEVFEALSLLRSSTLHGMKVSTKDFDSKPVTDGNVEIVDVNGLLEGYIISCGDECLSDKPFSTAGFFNSGLGFNSSSAFDEFGNGVRPSCCGDVCRSCLPVPFFRCHLGCPDKTGIRTTSDFASGISEPPNNCLTANGVDVGKLKNARSVLIALDNAGRCGKTLSSRLDSAALEGSENDVFSYTDLFGDLSCLHSGGIEVDYVSVVRHSDFVGHVYNLSTDGRWYFANDIIVHNCDCRVVPGFPGDEVEGYDPEAVYRRWQDGIDRLASERAERKGTSESDERAAIMRGYGNAAKAAKSRRKRA